MAIEGPGRLMIFFGEGGGETIFLGGEGESQGGNSTCQ